MAAKPERVLSLSTLTHRKSVAIDGVDYPLISIDELPYLEIRSYANAFQDAAPLFGVERPNAEQQDAIAAVMETIKPFVKAILLAPDEVHEKLSDIDRMKIATVFSRLLPAHPGAKRSGAKTKKRRTTSGKTSAR